MEDTSPQVPALDEENDMQQENNEEATDKDSCSTVGARRKYDGVEPFEGMVFESLDEAHNFYHLYAKVCGFKVRIRNTVHFPRSKEVRSRRFVCSCEGYFSGKKIEGASVRREKNTLTVRKGCPVCFVVSWKKSNSHWIATSVKNEHNHVLASPRSAGNLRNKKVMPSLAINLVEKFSEAGHPTDRVSDILNDESIMNFSRTMNLDLDDAESVLQYCSMKQAQDPNFYYSILPDKVSQRDNFFWVDSRARLCYERFGDVLVFDTTYKTNKYDMPFALFVGVNHHGQSILFGLALLQDETEESFQWLFTTWLNAMNGKAPISILTDQDGAIENAIKKVFPKTTHRLCLWHIMKKFPEKYGNLYKKKSAFKKDIKRCLYQSITCEEFDKEWKEIMSRYNLAEEAWLQQIFKIRSYWVPVYNQKVFYAGMNTIRCCKSTHSFFDSFVHGGTTLQEFVVKYEEALLQRYKDENQDYRASKHFNPDPKVRLPIAEHAAKVYTRSMFNMFEGEVLESLRLTKEKLARNESHYTYLVSNPQNSDQKYIVSIDTSSWDASCECHLFEFKGILCRHILEIFQKKDVHQIPAKYILSRWTKEAADDILTRDIDESSVSRTMHFYCKTNLLLPYLNESSEAYQVIMDAMDKAYKDVSRMKKSSEEDIQPEIEATDQPLADPQVSETKGRKKGLQNELSNAKKQKRKCTKCHESGHNISTCKMC